MALKPDRQEVYSDIRYFMNETGERGCIVIADTSVSGLGGLDDAGSVVKKPTDSGGAPIGMLMNDVVNVDLSRYRLNEQKDEVQMGSKVDVMRRGGARTNMIPAGINPINGSGAYYTTGGLLTTTNNGGNSLVGRWASSKDEDGFAYVEINLP